MHVSTNDLIRIVAPGGGITIDLGQSPIRSADELIRISAAASQSGATIKIVLSSAYLPVEDMIRIGAANKGKVVFQI